MVVVARRLLGVDDECDSSPAVPRYPLRSNPGVVLVSPLHTPHRRHNNLVSASRPGASATMSNSPDNRPPGASDPDRQDEILTTLHSIMAQLTSLSNRVDLQGSTVARHARLLEGTAGSAVAGDRSPSPDVPGGRRETSRGADPRHTQPSGRDHHDELKSSFYRPKLNFPRYDGESDPLPWLNR